LRSGPPPLPRRDRIRTRPQALSRIPRFGLQPRQLPIVRRIPSIPPRQTGPDHCAVERASIGSAHVGDETLGLIAVDGLGGDHLAERQLGGILFGSVAEGLALFATPTTLAWKAPMVKAETGVRSERAGL